MTTAPKPFVFVLMPFSKEFDDLYNLGIRPACEEAGAYCMRVDEQVYEGKIIDRIYNQITTADFIVAVMTGKNPNVFYEVGYAHALNKRVILTTNNVKDIPFDLASYPHIEYPNISELKQEVSKRLRFLIENPETASTYFKFPLKFLSDGKSLEFISEVPLGQSLYTQSIVAKAAILGLPFDIINSIEKSILQVDFSLGFICNIKLRAVQVYEGPGTAGDYRVLDSRQEDGRVLHLINSGFSLLPGEFKKFNVYFVAEKPFQDGEKISLTFRVLTAAGVFNRDFTFTMKQACAPSDEPV